MDTKYTPPSYIVTGEAAIMHAILSGTPLYLISRPGVIPLDLAMRMTPAGKAMLFAGVEKVPTIVDRQVFSPMATYIPIQAHQAGDDTDIKTQSFADEIARKDIRILVTLAIAIVVGCAVFAACLIVPRLL